MKSNLFGKLTSSVHILNCVMKDKDNDSYKKHKAIYKEKSLTVGKGNLSIYLRLDVLEARSNSNSWHINFCHV